MNPQVRGLSDQQPGGDQNNCSSQLKAYWDQVPAFCKFICVTTTVLYLSTFITNIPTSYLVNKPSQVIYSFQIWRIVTGSFVHLDLLQLLFSLLSYIPTSMMQEKLEGTVKQAFKFLVSSVMIQVIFDIVCFILGMTVSGSIMKAQSIGLWPVVICDIVIECNRSPELARNLCCLPIQIKAKYYPWALLALFTIFLGGFQLNLFIGLVVGYMHIYGMLKRFEIPTQKAKTWEAKFPFKYYAQNPSFVTADGAAGGTGLPTFVRTNPPSQNSQQRSTQPSQQPQSQQFKAFAGKGTKLGGSSGPGTASTSSKSSTSGSTKGKVGDDSLNSTRDDGTEGHAMKQGGADQTDYQKVNTDNSDSI